MRIASIDVGTNTVLLLIADIDTDGVLVPVHHEQALPRLGKDVDWHGRISDGAMDRAIPVITGYAAAAHRLSCDLIVAAGTSAIRDATNRDVFIQRVESACGVSIEVLDGTAEAYWSFRGATSAIPGMDKQFAVVDIGGGSTEITYPRPGAHNGDRTLSSYSLQIGAVRLTERHLKHSPPLSAELATARDEIIEELAQIRNPGFSQYEFVGVAGTVTTLACLDQGLPDFSLNRVGGYVLQRQSVAGWLGRLAGMEPSQILRLSKCVVGREDILTGGVLILATVMDVLGLSRIRVSERGLRYGLVLREWDRAKTA